MSSITALQNSAADTDAIAMLQKRFAAHKQAFFKHPFPDLRERRAHLYALADALLGNRARIREALQTDFGAHPAAAADLAEIGGPLARTLAAGNGVIIKMSEYAPACAEAVFEIIDKTFAADHVAVANGGVELGKAFTALRWDHLLYTGNPEVGAVVAQAAAANLVPVTLELGGKCPAIFAADGVSAAHITRLLGVKLVKNGQMCISIDHCLVPRAQLDQFVQLAQASFSGALKDYSRGADCTGIISVRHFQRQQQLLDEARNAGARIVQLDQGGGADAATRRLPVSLVIDPDPSLRMMKEEIFGPILPVIPYDSLDDTLATLNRGDRPPGWYF